MLAIATALLSPEKLGDTASLRLMSMAHLKSSPLRRLCTFPAAMVFVFYLGPRI